MTHIILGAFESNQVNLTSQGLWAHPDQNTYRYKDLSYWIELAKLLERGHFDFFVSRRFLWLSRSSGQNPGRHV